jgi:hypothetical protein
VLLTVVTTFWIIRHIYVRLMETLKAAHSATADAAPEVMHAVNASLADLMVVVPILLIFPLAGWNRARQLGYGVPVARCATLATVAVWVLSLGFLRYGLPYLLHC